MTPKELLAAAEYCEGMDNDYCGSIEVKKLITHILATVRADDDEPITMEWLQRSRLYGATEGMFRFQVPGTDVYIEWFSGDTCELIIGNSIIPDIDTRGQFRSLCRALGLTLPEVPAKKTCPLCNGKGGWETGPHSGDCGVCRGEGEVPA